jgi:hypothetical protein
MGSFGPKIPGLKAGTRPYFLLFGRLPDSWRAPTLVCSLFVYEDAASYGDLCIVCFLRRRFNRCCLVDRSNPLIAVGAIACRKSLEMSWNLESWFSMESVDEALPLRMGLIG